MEAYSKESANTLDTNTMKTKKIILLYLKILCFVFIVCAIVINLIFTKNMHFRGKAKIHTLTIHTIAFLLWPIVWSTFLGDNAYDSNARISLIWPLCLIALDIYLMKYHTLEEHSRPRKGLLTMDANALCTLAFALSSVLNANKDACCKNLFIYGVLGCIAFVMPSPDSPSQTIENICIETIQKVVLTYSTGLLLGGSLLLNK